MIKFNKTKHANGHTNRDTNRYTNKHEVRLHEHTEVDDCTDIDLESIEAESPRHTHQLQLDSTSDCVDSNSDTGNSSHAWEGNIQFHFEDVSSEMTFYGLITILNLLAVCYLGCMSMSACSSNYTDYTSSLDCIMLSIDILHVDISSCFFVVAGFVCSFIYSSIGVQEFAQLRNQMMAFIYVDLWASGLCSILFGSIDALAKQQFKFLDIFFTIFEQTTAIRVFDAQQTTRAPHNLNVGSWPMQCFVWCLLSVHMTHKSNNYLRIKFGPVGSYVIMVSAVCGITLFTLFGMLHSASNIFYANATSFTYRTLEFNLGIHFFYLLSIDDVIATTLMRLINQSSQGIFFVFVCIWWSEVGSVSNDNVYQNVAHLSPETSTEATLNLETIQPTTSKPETICLRMYFRNQCLRDHHAFLLRGCFLGITVISTFAYEGCFNINAQYRHVHNQKYVISRVAVISSAVAFCWPAYITIQLIFEITFSTDIIEHNMALMSVLQPMFLVSGAVLYSLFIKPALTQTFIIHANQVYMLLYMHCWQQEATVYKNHDIDTNDDEENVDSMQNKHDTRHDTDESGQKD